jgi:hypothetical protein
VRTTAEVELKDEYVVLGAGGDMMPPQSRMAPRSVSIPNFG